MGRKSHDHLQVSTPAPGRAGILAIWALIPGVPVLAMVTSRTFGSGPFASLWSCVALASGVMATMGIRQVTRSRPDLVTTATIATAGSYAWWWLATFLPNPSTGQPIGPLSWLSGVWILLAAPGCLTLTIRILPSVRGGVGPAPGSHADGGLAEALQDARVSAVEVSGSRVTADLTLPAGGDISTVQQQQRLLASELDIPVTAVRVTAVTGESPRHGRLTVITRDQLGSGVPWMELEAPGGPVSAPITLGRYEDGEPVRLWLTGDDKAGRNAPGIIAVVACKGAGKTVLMRRIVSGLLVRCPDEREFWLADPRKFGQLPAWSRAAATRTARNQAECQAMLDDLMQEASDRADWLGQRGHEQWVDGCGLPYLLVWIDEAAGLGAAAERLIDVAETVRSTGITVFVAYQRFTGDRVPTSARAQISTVICMGVKDQGEAARVLSDGTVAAGADPSAWADRAPGMAYLEASGVDEERWAMPWRVCRGDDAQIARELEALGVPVAVPAAAPATGRAKVPPPVLEEEADEEAETMDPDDDPRTPIECPDPPPRLQLDVPGVPRPDPATAARMIRERAVQLASQLEDGATIAPSDFGDQLLATGRAPSWLSGQLAALCAPGPGRVLVRLSDKGRYAPAPNAA